MDISNTTTNIENIDNSSPERLCLSVADRYFTQGYKINLPRALDLQKFMEVKNSNRNDVKILRHSNRICVVTLSSFHPIIANRETVKVVSVSFKVTDKCDRSKNTVSGKRKRGAQWLNTDSPLCLVTCNDGTVHTIYCGIRGSLVEMNERLLAEPSLIQDQYGTEGYIAIVLPKLQEADNMMAGLFSQNQYNSYTQLLTEANQCDNNFIQS